MPREYKTQPGTVAHRVVKFLEEHPGKEFSSPELCEELDVDLAGFCTFMRAAVRHGRVSSTEQMRNSRKTQMWKIGDGTPPAAVEEDAPLHTAVTAVKVRRGEMFPPATPDEPDVLLSFRTGILTLIGIAPDADGLVRVPASLVDRMRRQLAWSPPT